MYAKDSNSQKKPPVKPEKPKKTRSQSDTWKVYGGATLLVALAFFVTFQFIEPAPPKSFTIATGHADGAYYHFAQTYREEFAKHGVELNIRSTSGSVENLQLLSDASEDVQLAFVQSGTAVDFKDQAFMGLASIYLEPVWVFSKNKPASGRLNDLAGKTIAIGPDGSGTQAIARQILQDTELLQSTTPVSIGGADAITALSEGSIDAMIVVASYTSNTVQTLLRSTDIHLMSFNRADAYAKRYSFLSKVQLPQGSIDLAADIPKSAINLIAPAATLIAREDLHPALSDLIMQVSSQLFSGGALFSDKGQFPSPELLDFPLSAEAERFYKSGPPFLQRYLPFWAATLVDRLKVLLLPLLALLLPLSKILPPTYRWSVRKKIFHWYDELQLVDQSATEIPSEENLEHCLANLDKIENEVKEVEVPLGYAHELYVLRQHIDLLARQISIKEKLLENQRLGKIS